MYIAAKPANEDQRLKTLDLLDIFNNKSDARFDRITRVIAAVLDAPVAMVNLIGPSTQIIKSCFGVEAAGNETDRNISLCNHTILFEEVTIIKNTLEDERFKDNPNVTGGLKVRAYLGIPLRAVDGTHPGALCVIDTKPRDFTPKEIALLKDLSAWAEIELNSSQLREALDFAQESKTELEAQLAETKRLNELMVGRELKMAEMKQQIEELTAKQTA